MNFAILRKTLAAAALTGIAACSGGNGGGLGGSALPSAATQSAASNTASSKARSSASSAILSNIVGVGDSLTAGYQSGGFFGQLEPPFPNPSYPGTAVPPGQGTGWWADLYEQATGVSEAYMFTPGVSPLPLIKAPGLGNQIVPSSVTPPIAELKTTSCDTIDLDSYQLNKLGSVRLGGGVVKDVAVPGITLHEAVAMSQPLTPSCLLPLPGATKSQSELSDIVSGESGAFWPVLGGFYGRLGSNLTMVNAAVSQKPTLATVWLGANDVLKYAFTATEFKGVDLTAGQAAADERAVINSLKRAGAKVVVANLPDIINSPYFVSLAIPTKASQCAEPAESNLTCIIELFGGGLLDFPTSQELAGEVLETYAKTLGAGPDAGAYPTKLGQTPYLTLPGTLLVLDSLLSTGTLPKSLDPDGPESGLGANYVTPDLSLAIQGINNAINTGIANAASSTNVPMVDIKTIIDGIESGDASNPYYKQAISISPGVCCTFSFYGGLVGFDGLHPSNTGYALIAYYFIQTINSAYGTSIKQLNPTAVYDGVSPYLFPDPYAPHATTANIMHVRGFAAKAETYVKAHRKA
jgi:lysophospholipase L1-like esterase